MTATATSGRPTLDDLRAQGATTSLPYAAQALGLSRTTAYRLAAEGAIPTVRIGKSVRVPVDRLIRMLDQDDVA